MNWKLIGPAILLILLAAGTYAGVRLVNEPVTTVNFAAGPACERVHTWKCFLTEEDIARLTQYNLRWRLAAYDDDGALSKATSINDTRDQEADQTELEFEAEAGRIYECRLEVFNEDGTESRICSSMSGRLRCVGITPIPDDPNTFITPVSGRPTPADSSITPTVCRGNDGDVNRDGNVDTADMNQFVRTQFSDSAAVNNDLNCDGKVDIQDWSLLFGRVVRP